MPAQGCGGPCRTAISDGRGQRGRWDRTYQSRSRHPRLDVLEGAFDAAFAELQQVDALLSLYRPDSQLSRLNRDGRLEDPHPSLVTVLRESVELSRRTDGAFDATVQPLWESLRSS